MSKERIAVDVDEVLFPLVPSFFEYHNFHHGTELTLDQMTTYRLEDITGETTEEVMAKITAFVNSGSYRKAMPLEDVRLVKQLSQTFELVIVTAREHFYRGSTEVWLEKHFADAFPEVHYTHQIDTPDQVEPKYVICQRLKATTLIDDSVRNVTLAAENGVKAILFGDYPWNQCDRLPSGVRRCRNWTEVLSQLQAEKRTA